MQNQLQSSRRAVEKAEMELAMAKAEVRKQRELAEREFAQERKAETGVVDHEGGTSSRGAERIHHVVLCANAVVAINEPKVTRWRRAVAHQRRVLRHRLARFANVKGDSTREARLGKAS